MREVAVQAGRTVLRGVGVATADLRPEPDFLLIGAKRAGTTSLYYGVLEHPGVVPLFPPKHRLLPKANHTKGIHYFDTQYSRSARWYRSHLPSRRARARTAAAAGGVAVAGEGSPYYLWHPAAPSRAAGQLRATRLLVMLRDPVERTWSHWKEQTRNGVETLGFADALAAEPARTRGAEQRLLDDARVVSFAHEQQTYAAQSRYEVGLERWLAHWPRERLHVVLSEEFYADPAAELGRTWDFLGLPGPHPVPTAERRNAAPRDEGMDPGVRAELVERFAPTRAYVSDLLGRPVPWQGA